MADPARAQTRQHAAAQSLPAAYGFTRCAGGDAAPEGAQDRSRCGDAGIEAVARRDDGADRLQRLKLRRVGVDHGARQARHRAGPAHHQHAGGARLGVQGRNAGHERARVRKIEIVHARRDAGARQAVVLRLVGSRGVDQHMLRRARLRSSTPILAPSRRRGDNLRRTSVPKARRERFRLVQRPPGNRQLDAAARAPDAPPRVRRRRRSRRARAPAARCFP